MSENTWRHKAFVFAVGFAVTAVVLAVLFSVIGALLWAVFEYLPLPWACAAIFIGLCLLITARFVRETDWARKP